MTFEGPARRPTKRRLLDWPCNILVPTDAATHLAMIDGDTPESDVANVIAGTIAERHMHQKRAHQGKTAG
jgi:hypothetical protein